MGAIKALAEAAGRLCSCGRVKDPAKALCDECLGRDGRRVAFGYRTTGSDLNDETMMFKGNKDLW